MTLGLFISSFSGCIRCSLNPVFYRDLEKLLGDQEPLCYGVSHLQNDDFEIMPGEEKLLLCQKNFDEYSMFI